jgi:hypothetical protein
MVCASVRFRCLSFLKGAVGHHQFVRTVALSALLAVAAALLSAPAALASNPATPINLSTNAAGAGPVGLTVSPRFELQCGRLVGGSLVLTFPRQMRVPRAIAAAAVLIGTKAARSVTVAGRVVTIGVPLPRGMLCDSITSGNAKITFTRAAGLGNPKAPGAYALTGRRGPQAFLAFLRIV